MEAFNFCMDMESNSASSDQFSDCFFKPTNNWENSDPFESALSSIVSSPAATTTNGGAGEGVMIRELIGRLGNICNSGDTSANNSCYATPLNSPPKLKLFSPMASFAGDPGFAERAAKNSLFGTGQLGLAEPEFGFKSGAGKRANRNPAENDSREGSSVSDQIPMESAKKRKSCQRAKAKEIPSSPTPLKEAVPKVEESNAKRTKKDGGGGCDSSSSGKGESEKQREPFKDYIHVRARRGQATDSHSLAERVRREKISERMKFLQDLVPGCNKVTGKAVMLDEIINYVQSLQRQVEFLSMKLATVNPRMDFNMEALLSKDMFQSRAHFPLDSSALASFPFGYQTQLHNAIPNDPMQFPINALNNQAMHRTPGIQLSAIDGFPESTQQVSTFYEDDLQSLVQMGFGQIQQQSFQGSMGSGQMKVEQ